MTDSIIRETIRLLKAGDPVVWATVVTQAGSSPRGSGSRMLVRRDGSILGSVGGGPLEGEALASAAKLFENQGQVLLSFTLTNKQAAECQMVCGGAVEVFLETIAGDARPFLESIEQGMAAGQKNCLVTLVSEDLGGFAQRHVLWGEGGLIASQMEVSPELETHLREISNNPSFSPLFLRLSHGEALFVEPLRSSSNLYIFGGGHVALDLARMASQVAFEIIIIEDRKKFANWERFPMASRLIVAPYEEALAELSFGPGDFVVIVTRGHLFDQDILQAVLKHEPSYIGMIGSKRKKAIIYKHLLEQGVSRERLEQVYAPIGLDIQAETPAEIAVSILAELVQVRAAAQPENKKTWHV